VTRSGITLILQKITLDIDNAFFRKLRAWMKKLR
jgi:hypothetical protein